MRLFSWIVGWATVLAATGSVWAAGNDQVSESAAQRCGLTRDWVAQAQVDSGHGRLQSLVLNDGTLYAQTSNSMLEAIDAETGQKLWSKMVGNPHYQCLPPGAYRDLVATINGSRLFVLNRYTGDILYQVAIDKVPGGGPALSIDRAYVPTATGAIYAYRLKPVTDAAKELGKIDPNAANMTEDEKKDAARKAEEDRRENLRLHQEYVPPLSVTSDGRALASPVVTTQTSDEEYVTWVTDKGWLHLGRVDRRSNDALRLKFRLPTKGSFSNPPAYLPPNPHVRGDVGIIFGGCSDGQVYALSEHDGEIRWRFPAGDSVIDSPVLIGDRLYVTTDLGGMFAITAKTGKQIWWTPEIMHFVAAGRQRVYAADKLGRLRVLDGRTGSVLEILPTAGLPVKVRNNQTDRIYLATEQGVVQCLREVEEVKPIVYVQSPKLQIDDESPAKVAVKQKPKSGEGGAAKPAAARPTPKPAATKPAKGQDDGGFGDAAPAPKKGAAKAQDDGGFGDAAPATAPKPGRTPRSRPNRTGAKANGKAAGDAGGAADGFGQ